MLSYSTLKTKTGYNNIVSLTLRKQKIFDQFDKGMQVNKINGPTEFKSTIGFQKEMFTLDYIRKNTVSFVAKWVGTSVSIGEVPCLIPRQFARYLFHHLVSGDLRKLTVNTKPLNQFYSYTCCSYKKPFSTSKNIEGSVSVGCRYQV